MPQSQRVFLLSVTKKTTGSASGNKELIAMTRAKKKSLRFEIRKVCRPDLQQFGDYFMTNKNGQIEGCDNQGIVPVCGR